MQESQHHTIRTLSILLIAGFIGWAAYTYHASQGVYANIASDLKESARNVRTATWNASAIAWNLAGATKELNDPVNGLAPLLAALNGKHGVKQVLYNVDVLTAQIGRTSNTLRLASVEEQQELKTSSDLAITALESLGTLVANTDLSINGKEGVLPAITGDLGTLNASITSLGADSHGMIAAATGTLQDAGKVLSNPDIAAALHSLAETSVESVSVMKHVDGTTANTQALTGEFVDMFRPKKLSFWNAVLSDIVSHAVGPAAGALVTHWLPTKIEIAKPVTVNQ